MFDHEVFENAPITEALIDIRVQLRTDFDINTFDPILQSIEEDFPTQNKQFEQSHLIKVGADAGVDQVASQARQIGTLCYSAGRENAVQFRSNGFTYSKLKPYEDWESLRDTGRRLWDLYKESAEPERIVRLALRYINSIQIPIPLEDFGEFLSTGVHIADGLPQGIGELFSRMVIPMDDDGVTAIVTSAMGRQDLDNNVLPYTLDIDVFKIKDLDPNSDEIWEIFEMLRMHKNMIFFLSITERAKELFR